MKALLISDIHGNLEALESVLKLESWDVIYCMGDLVDYGPSPEEVVSLIRKRAKAVIRGNHDNAVAFGMDCGCSYEIKELSQEVRKYTIEQMSKDSIDHLARLPLEMSVNKIYMTHGTPGDMFAYIKPGTPESEFEVFSEVEENIILLGHSHIPMDRTVNGKRYINPGSLGQPRDGDWKGSYAFMENGELHFERVDYDIDKTVDKMKKAGLPDRAIRILKEGRVVE